MPLYLKKSAKEGSTYIVNITVKDEDGNLVPPNNLYWTLTDYSGQIINGRDNVEITDLSSSMDVVLTGDDLPPKDITFSVKGTYDSTKGNDLPIQDAVTFGVEDLYYQ